MKALVIATTLCVAQLGAAEKGFTQLFNGKDLSGWQGVEGPTTNWVAKDGILSCTEKKGSQWIATKKEFSNFDLRLLTFVSQLPTFSFRILTFDLRLWTLDL